MLRNKGFFSEEKLWKYFYISKTEVCRKTTLNENKGHNVRDEIKEFGNLECRGSACYSMKKKLCIKVSFYCTKKTTHTLKRFFRKNVETLMGHTLKGTLSETTLFRFCWGSLKIL